MSEGLPCRTSSKRVLLVFLTTRTILHKLKRPLDEYVFYALCLVVAAAPFGEGGESVRAIFLRHTALTVIAMGWALATLFARRQSRFVLLGYDPQILLFLALCLLSYATSFYKFSSENELVHFLFLTIYLYLLAQVLTPERGKKLLVVLLLVTAAQGGICLIQRFHPDAVRVSGSFYNPNMAATFILCGLAISTSCFLWMPRTRLRLVANSLLFGILLVSLLFVGSRSSILALLVLFGFFLGSAKRWKVALLLLISLGAFAIIPNISRDRLILQRGIDVYDYERIHIWAETVSMIRDHPLSGVGIGNFKYSTYLHNFPVEKALARYGRIFNDAHNTYLELCAEVGVPAFLVILALVAAALLQYRRARKDLAKRCAEDRVILQTALVLLCILFVQASFHDLKGSAPNVLVGLSALCLIRAHAIPARASTRSPATGSPGQIVQRILHENQRAVAIGFVLVLLVLVWPFSVLKAFLGHVWYKEALMSLARGDVSRGVDSLGKALATNPGQAFYYRRLADVSLHRFEASRDEKDLNNAMELYRKAISVNRRYPPFYRDLAECFEIAYHYSKNKKYLARAALQYENAVKAHPTNPFYRVRLALFYLQRGQEDRALKSLHAAADLEPNFITPRYLLAKVYEKRGDGRMAEQAMAQISAIRERYHAYKPRTGYEAKLILDPETYLLGEIARIRPFSSKSS